MPEPTSMGGHSCQVCGSTYKTQQKLIEDGREQHPGRPVTWGDPAGSTTSSQKSTYSGTTGKARPGLTWEA